MSKLTAFLKKTKEKHVEKQGQATAGEKAATTINDRSAPSPVSLDVVKPKVLEQWTVGEEEELVEEVSGARPVEHLRPAGESEDEDEIDLPSNKVRGNFEWKPKKKEEPVVPVAVPKAKPGDVPILVRRNKMHDISDPSLYPELGPPLQEASPVVKTEKKHKKEQTKAARAGMAGQAVTAERQKEKAVTVEDIYNAVGKWPAGWPRVAFDETASRSRYAKLQLPPKVKH